jgi:hypothetical protein
MIVYSRHDAERNVHIITSIEGDTVRSITYADTPKGMNKTRDWHHQLDELGFKSVDHYIEHMKKRGFKEVQPA